MSETKHMQGPWETHHGYDVTGYPCYYLHGVCGDGKRDTAVHEANARLIAAAPDLLDALKRYMSQFGQALEANGIEFTAAQGAADAAARGAIAKAEDR